MTHMESLCSFYPSDEDEALGAVPLVDVVVNYTISDDHGGATVTSVTLTRDQLVDLCALTGTAAGENWLAGVYADGREWAAE